MVCHVSIISVKCLQSSFSLRWAAFLEDLGRIRLGGIHWVVLLEVKAAAGARPMAARMGPQYFQEQCMKAEIPFFLQTMGRSA